MVAKGSRDSYAQKPTVLRVYSVSFPAGMLGVNPLDLFFVEACLVFVERVSEVLPLFRGPRSQHCARIARVSHGND